MLFDKKGKLFGKISIVDILVVIIIVAVIGGLYYKFGKSGTVTPFTKTNTIQMSIYNEEVPNYIVDNIKIGDVVKDKVQGVVVGKVVDVKSGPGLNYNANEQGIIVASSKPNYSCLTVVIEGNGIYSSAGVKFGGVDYFINRNVEWIVGSTNYYARTSDIKKVKE